MQHQNIEVGCIDFKSERGLELCSCFATASFRLHDSKHKAALRSDPKLVFNLCFAYPWAVSEIAR